MRGYATISPALWHSDVKKLRGDLEAIAVYWHLTTSNHSTMIGIYHLPVAFIAHELGSPLEGASKGLHKVCEVGIASYDEVQELVWVHDMAANQIAPRLAPKDNKVVSVAKRLANLPICPISLGFYEHYRELYHLADQPILEEFERAFRGASKPLPSKEQEKKQDQDLGSGIETIGSGGRKVTVTRARETDEQEFPYDPPATIEEGRTMLASLGVPPRFFEQALTRLMREALYPCDIENWKSETRGVA